jgi:hypothetical protein
VRRLSRGYEGNAARCYRRCGNRAGPASAGRRRYRFRATTPHYDIYGPRDYNAWLGKIVCDRLDKGVDANAMESTNFVVANLPRGTTQVQTWQFFGTAISYYCPDETPVLENVAAQ